jgi:hypothetical protein
MRFAAIGVAACVGAMAGAGCQKQDTQPRYLDILPSVSETDTINMQPIINDTRLAATSPPVRLSFMHDFPTVGVTNITTMKTAAGQVLYRITFTNQGNADFVIYNDDGLIVQPPLTIAPLPPGANIKGPE